MINFTRAFESAWERTQIILFRPFDSGKWFVIGFNAFLALFAEGGVAINNTLPFQGQNQSYAFTYHSFPAALHAAKQLISWAASFATSPWLALYVALGLAYLVVWVALNWVGCRAEFLFLDNIVRNRAAISWPWHRYARQGNGWFIFHLGVLLVSCLFFLAAAGAFLALNWPWINGERDPSGGEAAVLALFLLVLFGLWIVYATAMFLIRSFALPLYFKQSMGLGAALLAVARLTATHPLGILCYVLISGLLAIAGGILSFSIFCVVCCVICWLACIPFVGSMLLSLILCQLVLPVLIFFRCFQLDCLAQFGPDYDVWTVDVPPPGPGAVPPFIPPPPPG
jgi:hypothetical protein